VAAIIARRNCCIRQLCDSLRPLSMAHYICRLGRVHRFPRGAETSKREREGGDDSAARGRQGSRRAGVAMSGYVGATPSPIIQQLCHRLVPHRPDPCHSVQ
jgi:hypothetical protein